jgi:endonuclease YncB( thermonuclease family)
MPTHRPGWKASAAPPRRFGLLFDIGLAIAILGLLALVVARVDRAAMHQVSGAVVVHDGDTMTFSGERIRLRGIDAPEYAQTCRRDGADYPCGLRAREALVGFIAGRAVTCEGGERDRYDRLLAVCRAGELDLNRALVETGWAVAYGDYEDAERLAREQGTGIWAGTFERPRDWRDRHGGLAEPRHDGNGDFLGWLQELLRFW